jgi:phosphotransferase system enzyme I (PtsI)
MVTGRASLPTENEQYEYFRRVSAAFPGQDVIIRTYDLGGDKFPAAFDAPPEANPFLGWRSIRVCLDRPEIFRPQLRAILRVAVDRRIRVMLPLVTRVDEVLRAREMLAEEADNLTREGVRCAPDVPVGVMIETPAAVVIADRLARVSAFFSLGTNDLTQYTMAVDRGSAHLASRFTPHDPAVLAQLVQIVAAGRRHSIPVGVCGEMASDPLSALLLIGLGFESLSVSPPILPLVKWLVRKVPLAACQAAAQAACDADSADAVPGILRAHVSGYFDLRLVDRESPLPGRAGGTSLQL